MLMVAVGTILLIHGLSQAVLLLHTRSDTETNSQEQEQAGSSNF